jgi:hypothetical protein
MLALAAAAPGAVHYDCVIEKQFVITPQKGDWNNQTVTFPTAGQADWRFSVDLFTGARPTARVTWALDLVQIAGTHPALALAPGHYAFAAASAGPCMFTEQACLALVELADRDETSASVLISPAGLTIDEHKKRSRLQVTSLGSCRRSQDKS